MFFVKLGENLVLAFISNLCSPVLLNSSLKGRYLIPSYSKERSCPFTVTLILFRASTMGWYFSRKMERSSCLLFRATLGPVSRSPSLSDKQGSRGDGSLRTEGNTSVVYVPVTIIKLDGLATWPPYPVLPLFLLLKYVASQQGNHGLFSSSFPGPHRGVAWYDGSCHGQFYARALVRSDAWLEDVLSGRRRCEEWTGEDSMCGAFH